MSSRTHAFLRSASKLERQLLEEWHGSFQVLDADQHHRLLDEAPFDIGFSKDEITDSTVVEDAVAHGFWMAQPDSASKTYQLLHGRVESEDEISADEEEYQEALAESEHDDSSCSCSSSEDLSIHETALVPMPNSSMEELGDIIQDLRQRSRACVEPSKNEIAVFLTDFEEYIREDAQDIIQLMKRRPLPHSIYITWDLFPKIPVMLLLNMRANASLSAKLRALQLWFTSLQR